MGQYYHNCILAEDKKTIKSFMYSHDYGSGLKLMEHSWMLNEFVGAFESQIVENPQHVVWAGDYADAELDKNGKERKTKEGYNITLYSLCEDKLKVKPKAQVISIEEFPFLVNHTTKKFIDKRKVKDVDGWKIHPLPLLTVEGNNRGGGDYHTHNKKEEKLVGSWSRDLISLEKTVPKGFKEIQFTLYED
jgi:hypothetical protein